MYLPTCLSHKEKNYFDINDLRSFAMLLKHEKFRPERNSNPDLCNASAVTYQLSHQANWQLIIMWVNDKPVDSGYMRSN